MTEHRLAGHIEIRDRELIIDGEVFPFHIAEEGPVVEPVPGIDDGFSTVTIRIYAERVTDERG
jgi:hypothetical protein